MCVWCCRDLLKPSDEGGLSKPWPSLTCGCRKRIGSEENWKRLVRRLGHDEAVKPGNKIGSVTSKKSWISLQKFMGRNKRIEGLLTMIFY